MFFDVTFSDGTVQVFQAHNKQILMQALKNVRIRKIIKANHPELEGQKQQERKDATLR
jgi:hypothetical protein